MQQLETDVDTWVGDGIAESREAKSEPLVGRLATAAIGLATAVLRFHIGSPGKVRSLRRFLAALLPAVAEQNAVEGTCCFRKIKKMDTKHAHWDFKAPFLLWAPHSWMQSKDPGPA